MNVALVVVTDGRPYLADTLASMYYDSGLDCPHRILVDDSGTGAITKEGWFGWTACNHPERLGFIAAVNSGWRAAVQLGADYVFHLEDDFTFNEPVDLAAMVATLDAQPDLAQIVLRRQPWSPEEHARGTILREPYGISGPVTVHDHNFSTNPCLIPRGVFEQQFAGDEMVFTRTLQQQGRRFAFWGAPDDPPKVTHIGEHRSAGWRL